MEKEKPKEKAEEKKAEKPEEKKAEEKKATEEKKQEKKEQVVKKEKVEEEAKEKIKGKPKAEETKVREEGRKEKPEKEKKEAIVRGRDLPISTKNAVAICKLIRGKKIDSAIALLEKVCKKKVVVPFPSGSHKKGIRGRYPIKTASCFIKLLKNLAANANINALDISELHIHAKADTASRPLRSAERRFKRTHVIIIARKIKEKKE